jgi:hypothetical protein
MAQMCRKALVQLSQTAYMEYIVYGTWTFKRGYKIQAFLACMLDAGK